MKVLLLIVASNELLVDERVNFIVQERVGSIAFRYKNAMLNGKLRICLRILHNRVEEPTVDLPSKATCNLDKLQDILG